MATMDGSRPVPAAFAGRWADGLTAGRMVLAMPLIVSTFSGRWTATAALLAMAWWSDFLDGKLARISAVTTRLAGWDLIADTTVGTGVLVGLLAGGHLPVGWGVVGGLLGLVFVVFRNPAASFLLQGIAYSGALWFIAGRSALGLSLTTATIAVIAVLDARHFVGWVLPTFFRGISGRPGSPR